MATVLVVDDVETDRKLVGKVVQKTGHSPVYAESGEEAITKATQLKPALILMDVVMPTTNGFKVCRDLKSEPETASIPVVLVTSKSAESDRFWGMKQGADDYLPKPFAPEALEALIKRFLG